jgi:hypothetical protein
MSSGKGIRKADPLKKRGCHAPFIQSHHQRHFFNPIIIIIIIPFFFWTFEFSFLEKSLIRRISQITIEYYTILVIRALVNNQCSKSAEVNKWGKR